MVLRDLRWFQYTDKKWDLMNLLKDNTFEIIETPTVVKYLPGDLGRYIEENDFAEYHLAVKVVDEQSSTTMTFFNINRIDEEKLGADAIIGMRYATAQTMQGAAELIAFGTAVKTH